MLAFPVSTLEAGGHRTPSDSVLCKLHPAARSPVSKRSALGHDACDVEVIGQAVPMGERRLAPWPRVVDPKRQETPRDAYLRHTSDMSRPSQATVEELIIELTGCRA